MTDHEEARCSYKIACKNYEYLEHKYFEAKKSGASKVEIEFIKEELLKSYRQCQELEVYIAESAPGAVII